MLFWCYYKGCHFIKFYFLIVFLLVHRKNISVYWLFAHWFTKFFCKFQWFSCKFFCILHIQSGQMWKMVDLIFPISIPPIFSCLISLAKIASVYWIEVVRADILIPTFRGKFFNIWSLIMILITHFLADVIMTGCQIYEMIVLLLMRR